MKTALAADKLAESISAASRALDRLIDKLPHAEAALVFPLQGKLASRPGGLKPRPVSGMVSA